METPKNGDTLVNIDQNKVLAKTSNQDPLSEANTRFSLPVKYWVPTLISVISGTALLIWFIFSLINPIEKDIIELKSKGITSNISSPIVTNTLFLENTDGTVISNNQSAQIKSIVYKLQQRKDLVLFVAGYSNDNLDKDQFQKVVDSKKAAERIRSIIISQGIDQSRIYFDGFGQDVPNKYFKDYKNNVALILINVFELMKASIEGTVVKAI